MVQSKDLGRQSPRSEAIGLFRLYKSSDETAETINNLIQPDSNAPDPYREEIFRIFNTFLHARRVCRTKCKKTVVAKVRKIETDQYPILAAIERITTFILRTAACCLRLQRGEPPEEPLEIAQVVTQPVDLQPVKAPPVFRRSRKPLTTEEIERANRALRLGATTADVAQRFGVSKMSIQRHCFVRRRRRGIQSIKDWREIRATIQAEKAKAASA
jgi:hypothetical protein